MTDVDDDDLDPLMDLTYDEPLLPARETFPADTARAQLVADVRDTLHALPAHFASKTFIEGLEAGDLFSLNSMLGGGIEVQAVDTLNKLRDLWDPDERWQEYRFVRSSQTFPDVRLETTSQRRIDAGERVALGIELKGWYLLSKERQPSLRYKVNRNACDLHDLVAVFPWHLTNVLSGYPTVYRPYIESARHAADLRDYYWTVERQLRYEAVYNERLSKYQDDYASWELKAAAGKKVKAPSPPTKRQFAAEYFEIRRPANADDIRPYPPAKSKTADKAIHDSGDNFGRLGRSRHLMANYIENALETSVSGIAAKHWVQFFKVFSDGALNDSLDAKITRLAMKHLVAEGLLSEDLGELLREWSKRLAHE